MRPQCATPRRYGVRWQEPAAFTSSAAPSGADQQKAHTTVTDSQATLATPLVDTSKGGATAVWCDDAIKHPDFPIWPLPTYTAICRRASSREGKERGKCRAGIPVLANDFGIAEGTVASDIEQLRRSGFTYVRRASRAVACVVAGDRSGDRLPLPTDPQVEIKREVAPFAEDLTSGALASSTSCDATASTVRALRRLLPELLIVGAEDEDAIATVAEPMDARACLVPAAAEIAEILELEC